MATTPPTGGAPAPGGAPAAGPGGPARRRGRGFGKGRYTPKRKVCAFCVDKLDYIDFKDVARLRRYVSDRGKIEPRRKTGTCAKHQRALTDALKIARHMALLPFTAEHIRLSAGVGTRNAPLPPPAPGIAQPRGQFLPPGTVLPRPGAPIGAPPAESPSGDGQATPPPSQAVPPAPAPAPAASAAPASTEAAAPETTPESAGP